MEVCDVHVVSCYAPTGATSKEEKKAFFQEVDSIISAVPAKEKYIILGNFNARVGSREHVAEQWDV